jgi:integrase
LAKGKQDNREEGDSQMSLYRRTPTGNYWFRFEVNGSDIRESAKTKNKRLAGERERQRRDEIVRGMHRLPKQEATPLFSKAAKTWLAERVGLAEKTLREYRYYVRALSADLGKRLVTDIGAEDVSALQQRRLRDGKGGRTINFETGVLQQILKRWGAWTPIADRVTRIPEDTQVGKALTHEEEGRLLEAAGRSASPVLLPLVILSVDTGLRSVEARSLRRRDLALEWQNGVIVSGSLVVERSKTDAGTGRVVPLTQRVCAALTLWLSRFPKAGQDAHVFPRHGVSVSAGREPLLHAVEFDKPLGNPKGAWKRARETAGLKLRWHDLRHTFITRLCESPNVSEETIRSLAGHVSQQMMRRYSHVRNRAKQNAIEELERGLGGEHPVQKPAHSIESPTTAPH